MESPNIVSVFMEDQIMLNKENPNYPTSTKEEGRKQFGKSDSKDKGGQFKSESKPQQNKTQPGTKSHNKECSGMSEEDEECESSTGTSKSCN